MHAFEKHFNVLQTHACSHEKTIYVSVETQALVLGNIT